MVKTIRAEISGKDALATFWAQYFMEIPVCSHPECGTVASEVDTFFPYLDDLNRCENHPLESRVPKRWAARARGCREGRRAAPLSLGYRARRCR